MIAAALSRVDDWINPIVVKELRQAVQSRLVLLVLLLFLAVQMIVLGVSIVISQAQQTVDVTDFRMGRGVFHALQFILLGTCAVLVPVYCGTRVGLERLGSSSDLFYITALRPVSIVVGKFFSAALLVLLVFSACAPFLTFTYLLRGLDIPTILLVMLVDFLVALGAVQFAIFLGALPTSWLFKIGLAIVGLICLLYLFGWSFLLTWAIVEEPFGVAYDDWRFLGTAGSLTLGWLALIGMLFVWSVALVSPPTANRVLPMRIYLVVVWLASLGAAFIWAYSLTITMPFTVWAALMLPLIVLQLAVSVNERESWEPRMARTIPRWIIFRPLAFVFYTGSAGGVLFCLGLFALTMLVLVAAPAIRPTWTVDRYEHLVQISTLLAGLYATAYLMAGMALRRVAALGQPKLLRFTWVFGVGLFVIGFTVPFVLANLVSSDPWRFLTEHPEVSVTNPFSVIWEVLYRRESLDSWFPLLAAILAGGAAALGVSANVPFFVLQALRFAPPPPPRRTVPQSADRDTPEADEA